MLSVAGGDGLAIGRGMGSKIQMSKKARPPQNPLATISNLASWSVMAEASERHSPVTGYRVGSMQTSWHTSAIRLAVRSLTSLCCIIGKPLYGRERARSTVKLWPHKQWVGMFLGCQPYLKATASQKAPSCRTKLNFFNGSEVSQLEAPFSCPKSMALCNVAGTLFLMTDADSLEVFRCCWWTALFCCDLGLDALKGALQPLLFNKVAQRWWDGFRGAELSSGHPGWIRNAETSQSRWKAQATIYINL